MTVTNSEDDLHEQVGRDHQRDFEEKAGEGADKTLVEVSAGARQEVSIMKEYKTGLELALSESGTEGVLRVVRENLENPDFSIIVAAAQLVLTRYQYMRRLDALEEVGTRASRVAAGRLDEIERQLEKLTGDDPATKKEEKKLITERDILKRPINMRREPILDLGVQSALVKLSDLLN